MSTPAPNLSRYLVQPDFLPDDLAADLLAFAVAAEPRFAPTQIGNAQSFGVNPAVRVSHVLKPFEPFKSLLGPRFHAMADGLIAALRISPFQTVLLELELVAHGDGAFYARHVDLGVRGDRAQRTQRVLSGVYYFHGGPKAFEGGALRIHDAIPSAGAVPQSVDIAPVHNSAVFFPAWVPHEVRPVRVPSGRFADRRFAINCWFHEAKAS